MATYLKNNVSKLAKAKETQNIKQKEDIWIVRYVDYKKNSQPCSKKDYTTECHLIIVI